MHRLPKAASTPAILVRLSLTFLGLGVAQTLAAGLVFAL